MTVSIHQQAAYVRQRQIESYVRNGARVVGLKISLTSHETPARVGTDRPIWGWLTDTIKVRPGSVIHDVREGPVRRAEPELVFTLGRDLVGPGVTSRDVLDATETVRPAIELPARSDGDASPSAADLIARNALASGCPLGPAASANALGHPANAIASVAYDLAQQDGRQLLAGQLVFTGEITAPVTLSAGMTVEADLAHRGRVAPAVESPPQGT